MPNFVYFDKPFSYKSKPVKLHKVNNNNNKQMGNQWLNRELTNIIYSFRSYRYIQANIFCVIFIYI